ncbi:unnamed protein product [Ranitomeya imitator]|uniref:Uncharacterized protein n=1 Tax=Ranitomeya imitator TaxID=111125 RepID=A0ABN9L0L8_9NEOB|nr:unnamed protein product [Ranitomeya imitator]
MNGIQRITVIPGEFPQLEVLDLSYNSLFPGDILQLGALPRLRVLCLSGNRLTHLPLDLSAPPTKDPEIRMFQSLEVFMLDDNLLSPSRSVCEPGRTARDDFAKNRDIRSTGGKKSKPPRKTGVWSTLARPSKPREKRGAKESSSRQGKPKRCNGCFTALIKREELNKFNPTVRHNRTEDPEIGHNKRRKHHRGKKERDRVRNGAFTGLGGISPNMEKMRPGQW